MKLDSQPRGMDILRDDNVVIAASVNEISVIQDSRVANRLKVKFEPSCVSISKQGHAAVGGAADNKVHVYELSGTNLTNKIELDHLGPITDVAYSPDDNYLVASDANRKVILYNTSEYKVSIDFCISSPSFIVLFLCNILHLNQ